MIHDPLAMPPAMDEIAHRFLCHFGVTLNGPPAEQLQQVASAFATLPYENLTKIIRSETATQPEQARRLPAEVIGDHLRLGTGGTCFSLTASLLYLLRSLGWQAEPILADRRYGANTHCALLVWLWGTPHLIDPGYLITRPIPLFAVGENVVATEFNELILRRPDKDGPIELHTRQGANVRYRLSFKPAPADGGAFLKAWDASFDWDMMRYPVLTRLVAGRQLYLQDNQLSVRSRSAVERGRIDADELFERIITDFGLAPDVARRALEILQHRGERHGRATAP